MELLCAQQGMQKFMKIKSVLNKKPYNKVKKSVLQTSTLNGF